MSPASTPPSEAPRDAPVRRWQTAAAGFTVLELLVVLVIVGLVSGVLLTGFERILDIRLRLAAFLDGVEAPVLVSDWFRATVAGLVADASTGHDRFVGAPRRFTGLSLAPLNGTAGVPTRITWEVVFDPGAGRSYLRYGNAGDPAINIASWPGDYGALRYCDAALVCRDSWATDPKAPQAQERQPQLPALIRLDAVKGTEPWPILAGPASGRDPISGSP